MSPSMLTYPSTSTPGKTTKHSSPAADAYHPTGDSPWPDSLAHRRSPVVRAQTIAASQNVRCLAPYVLTLNATPVPRADVMTGVPVSGTWNLVLCSDDPKFGGSGFEQSSSYESSPDHHNGFEQSIWLTLPALSVTILRLTS